MYVTYLICPSRVDHLHGCRLLTAASYTVTWTSFSKRNVGYYVQSSLLMGLPVEELVTLAQGRLAVAFREDV